MHTPNAPLPQPATAIPPGTEACGRFILWRPAWNELRQVWDKVPCGRRGWRADAHDPAHWLGAGEALAAAAASGGELGVGIVLDSSDGLFCVDLDGALVGGAWSPLALEVAARFPGAAVEVSWSGRGLHIFGTARPVPPHRTSRKARAPIELYSRGRFVALTGQGARGRADADCTAALAALVADYRLEPDPEEPPAPAGGDGAPRLGSTGWQMTDEELLEAMRRARGGAAVQFGDKPSAWDLYSCDREALRRLMPQERPDGEGFARSEADAALMSHLAFWTGCDEGRMRRLFERSPLYRPERYEGAGAHRMRRIVGHAAASATRVYDRPREAPAGAWDGDPYAPARATAQASWGAPAAVPEPLPEPVDAADLAGAEPPPREWTVDGLIPHRQVTLFSGDGGVGKTQLLLQLALAAACMVPWLGLPVAPRRVLFVSGEDEMEELHFRVHQAAQALGVQVPRGVFQVLSLERVASPELVQAAGRGSPLARTAVFGHLVDAARRGASSLIFLDPAADLYGGDEIDRRQVKQFVGMLRRELAVACGATVVLAAHPSVDAMRTGRGYSGTTAWNNSVRSRLYFTADDEDDDARVLEHAKSNRGRRARRMRLRWRNGVFVAEGGAALEPGDVDEAFMELLQRRMRAGVAVCASAGARNYAPALFEKDEHAGGASRVDFERAMLRLLETRRVVVVREGKPSRMRELLVPAS